MTTYHQKTLYCNITSTSLVSSTGTKTNTPVFIYKDKVNLSWVVKDSSKTLVDLTGASFELKIAGQYNDEVLLTVANGSFTTTGIAIGQISCLGDLDQAAILTFVNNLEEKTAHASLWATLGGINYLLASFNCIIKNIIY